MLKLSFIVFMTMLAINSARVLDPNLVDTKKPKVHSDVTTKTEGTDNNCTYVRRTVYELPYADNASNPNKPSQVYYEIIQCLDNSKEVKMEEVRFTYNLNEEFQHLPEGCPPPSIEPPTEASPCENGYEIG